MIITYPQQNIRLLNVGQSLHISDVTREKLFIIHSSIFLEIQLFQKLHVNYNIFIRFLSYNIVLFWNMRCNQGMIIWIIGVERLTQQHCKYYNEEWNRAWHLTNLSLDKMSTISQTMF